MVEYIDETHTYMIDGVIVPSVTQIVDWYFNKPYRGVPEYVLKRAQDYGTKVHADLEAYENKEITDSDFVDLKQWQNTKDRYDINIRSMEEIVTFEDKFAGRFDMFGAVGGVPSLIDVKTTSQLHKDYLALQLGLYSLAMGGVTACYVYWIPKHDRPQFKRITPFSENMCRHIVEEYLSNANTGSLAHESETGVQIYSPDEIEQIRAFMRLKEEITAIEEDGKRRALEYMKSNGIKSFDGDLFKITYVEPTTKKTVDTAKLKEDGLYDQYTKDTDVKESVRITWRLS